MGVVFKARHIALNRIVALKMIRADRLTGDGDIRRFGIEAQAAAQLQHSNIVAIHDVGQVQGQHFYTMDYIAGQNLSQVAREKPLPPRLAAQYVQKIAAAIQYAHERGILHRDLKPTNVLIDQNDEPQVTDFGLAKMVANDSEMTTSGMVIGSPSYMPPEQASGRNREVSVRSDVYSLGAILYDVLCGRPPFRADTTIETLKQVVETEPVLPRLLNPRAPRDLETIVLKCLQKEPGKRYGSAQELADELGRFLRGELILARPVSAPEKVLRWCKRKPALAALAMVFVFGFVGILWQWQRANTNATSERRERRNAQFTVTRLEIDRAEMLFERGQAAEALAYLARVLRREPTNRVAGERIISALAHRNFCVPLFQLELKADVTSAEFSPDGRRVLTSSKDGTARVWDGKTGEPLLGPLQHADEVSAAHFSRDGARIVTVSLDKTARIWNAQTGQPLTAPLQHEAGVWCADFSPDGQRLLTGSQEGLVRQWNVTTGELLGSTGILKVAIKFVKFSPDGKWIALATSPGYEGALLNAADWSVVSVYSVEHSVLPSFPSFSLDGSRLITSIPKIIDILGPGFGGTNRFARAIYKNGIKCARFSPDGQYVAASSFDSAATIWDAHTLQRVGELMRHEHWVEALDFSPDGQKIVTGSKDHTARIWDAHTGNPLSEPLRHEANVVAVQFSPDGQRVLTMCEGRGVWVWDVRGEQPFTATLQHGHPVRKAVFSPDGNRTATVTLGQYKGDTLLRLWDAQKAAAFLPPLGAGEMDVQFSPDGQRVAATAGSCATVWNSTSGKMIGAPFSNGDAVECVRFSPDGQMVVLAGIGSQVSLWSIATGGLLREWTHQGPATFAQFSPNGRWIMTASTDKTARLWDWRTGNPMTEPLRHEGAVVWADVSADSQRVVTLSRDQKARIWEAASGKLLHTLTHAGEPYKFNSVQFSPDGSLVVIASGNTAQIWDSRTGQPITAPLKHDGRVNSVRFSPDGRRLVTSCHDGTARLWDVTTGHSLSEPLRHQERVIYAEFSSDGRRVITASDDGTAKIWEVPMLTSSQTSWVADWAEAVAGQRIEERNANQWVPFEAFRLLRQRLNQAQAQVEDEATRWARWFFAENQVRAISPNASLKVSQLVDQRIGERTLLSLQQAVRLSPTNGAAQGWLAFITLTNETTPTSRLVASSEWQSLRSLELSPNEPDAWYARAQFCMHLGRHTEALQAMDRAARLNPNMSDFWNCKGFLLEKTNRLEEAVQAYTRAIALSGPWKDPESLPALAYENRSKLNRRLNRLAEAAADHLHVFNLELPPRAPGIPSTLLDLTLFYNNRIDLNVSTEPSHNFTKLPSGRQTLAGGTEFDIRGVIALAMDSGEPAMYGQVLGIPVAPKCRRLHFLHVGSGQMKQDGIEVGLYRVHYADGQQKEIPIIYGEHLRDHTPEWDPRDVTGKNTKVAWDGDSPFKSRIRLFETTWENDRPGVDIVALDFLSKRTGTAPILFAVTVEP
jgi:WD40 repeat protein/tRNA A-37 threonylcarbamoyl transferase component Bud32